MMTIDDPVQHSSLILPSPVPFYRARIPYKHWQLRSLLCTPESNVLFYPSGRNIYSLNTATRRRELVASLPFNPRCLGAKYGWACAGGKDNGHFASIRIGDYGKFRASQEDESVVMEMDAEEEPTFRPEVKISELGGSIVNSITLHRPPGSKNNDDVLAILTNNDQTVRVFSLAQNRVQATLHLPISTNHASISPDGKHLVVVGDSTKVYFYHSTSGTPKCETGREPWTLSSQLTAGTYEALISTAFSPSSVLCAVASQDGSITVFDTRYLSSSSPNSPSPIVKQILSSRPTTYAGAIRSVQFSPAPWDLLIWAEHSGRVTIADARSNFNKRQVIDVLGSDDNVVDVEVSGVSDDTPPSVCQDEQTHSGSTREEEDLEEAAAADEMEGYFRTHFLGQGGWMVNPTVSTAPHYPVSSSPRVPTSNHTTPRHNMRNVPNPAAPSHISPGASFSHVEISANQDSTPPTTSGTRPLSPEISSLLRSYREQQLERDRARHNIPTAPSRVRNNTADPSPPIYPPHPEHPTTAHDGNGTSPTRPIHWRIDYEAQRRPIEEVNQLQRNREQLSQMIAEERRRNVLRRTLHANRRYGFYGGSTSSGEHDSEDCSDEVNITGCTMSVDGGKLYVATKKGVVEYNINLASRRVFPSIKMR